MSLNSTLNRLDEPFLSRQVSVNRSFAHCAPRLYNQLPLFCPRIDIGKLGGKTTTVKIQDWTVQINTASYSIVMGNFFGFQIIRFSEKIGFKFFLERYCGTYNAQTVRQFIVQARSTMCKTAVYRYLSR